jgi:hypothetical protein
MAYFIFLKSLSSLEEFRKNPLVKISPKSPCANFQTLSVFKNQILFRKEFSLSLSAHPAFRPSHGPFFFFQPAIFLPPLPHWASASRPAQPILTAQPATIFFLPHRSRARTTPPAGLAPPPGSTPTPPPEEKKTAASIPFILPLIGAISPSSITGNRRLQPGLLKLLQCRPLKSLGLASAL